MHIVTIKAFTACRQYAVECVGATITRLGYRAYPNLLKGEVHFYVDDAVSGQTIMSQLRKEHKLLIWTTTITSSSLSMLPSSH